jgi:hypothetical protein
MDGTYLTWFGYFASTVIALSMTMNSIVKFRWINLVGASSFAIYGYLIGAFPVLFLNGIIVFVDIYYLSKIYLKSELFDIIEIKGDNKYLDNFLAFHEKDIKTFFPGFEFKKTDHSLCFFVLRNLAVTGIFLAGEKEGKTLEVHLDYVCPEYRDYKNGKYIYHRLKERFANAGYHQITSLPQSKIYNNYLTKMGFEVRADGSFKKNMVN